MSTARTFEDVLNDPQPGEPVYRVAENYPRQGKWTAEDFYEFEESFEGRVELVDGRLEFLAMPKRRHQRLQIRLAVILFGLAEATRAGEVLDNGVRIRLQDGTVRMPDLAFMKAERAAQQSEDCWDGADLVVEIVSPDQKSRERDYVEKRADYAAASIPEYWVVDPDEESLTIFALEDGATEYREHFRGGPGTTAASARIHGFEIDVTRLFADDGA
ncbi:MAG: Uma2 family endonuclease [Planctomycetota bacterium]